MIRFKTCLLPIFLISLMVSTILFNVSTTAESGNKGPKTKVYIYPKKTSKLGIGETFTVDVKVDNVDDLYAYEFKLNYNPEVLEYVGISSSFLNQPTFKFKKSYAESGMAWLATSSMYPADPKTEGGVLATITFKVIGMGESTLDLYNTKLLNFDIKRINHDVKDGYFKSGGNKKEGVVGMEALEEGIAWTCEGCPDTEQSSLTESFDVDPLSNGGIEVCDRMDNDGDSYVDEPDVCCRGDVDHEIVDNYYNVGLEDAGRAGLAFASTPGNPRWDPYCDLKEDERINVFDFNIIGRNFGNSCLAGCVNIKVEDGNPLEGADVYVVNPSQFFGTTNSTGDVTRCCLLDPGDDYEIYAIYNGAQFCPNTGLTVDSTGDGSATIIGGQYKVTVHVQDEYGSDIEEALVYIYCPPDYWPACKSGWTDNSGNYETCLEDGEYLTQVYVPPDYNCYKYVSFSVPSETYALVQPPWTCP